MGICASATWATEGETVAGRGGKGANLDQLKRPRGAFVDDTGAIYITDDNLRVVKWEFGASIGVKVAGFGGKGSNNDQFELYLHNLAVNKEGTMFICDNGNQRVMRWIENARSGEVILSTINCFGVALDDEGSLYVSNLDENLILKYHENSAGGQIVAGGNGQGSALNQFDRPHFPFVDHNFNIFIPDTDNLRIMKWSNGSTTGIIVSEDNGLNQLSAPHAVVVDELDTIYIVDHNLHHVIRWFKDAQSGEILFGGYGNQTNQLAYPTDIDFDREGNLYITDRNNHRIQKYAINKTSCHLSISK
jgi:DNA-binding beta-propeller fold protein YncE